MKNNVLEVLRIADKQDVVSDLLAYCIERTTKVTSRSYREARVDAHG
jgi:hypothetical protein